MLQFLAFFTLLLWTLPLSVQAQAVQCDAQKLGEIKVSWTTKEIKYNHTRTSTQLNHYDIDTQSPYAKHVKTDVGGLMSGEIEVKSGFNFSLLRYPTQQRNCIWFDSMHIQIEVDPTIYIAREHKPGTCRYAAIKEHELKHVHVDRQLVQKYTRQIQERARAAVRKVGVIGPRPDNDVKRVQAKMQKYIEDALAPVFETMYAEREKRQQDVDSYHEYERVRKLCPETRS